MRAWPLYAKQVVLSVPLALGCSIAVAGLSPEQIARLGADLTPLGAEKAGNADGTIPEWTGGMTKPPGTAVLPRRHRATWPAHITRTRFPTTRFFSLLRRKTPSNTLTSLALDTRRC